MLKQVSVLLLTATIFSASSTALADKICHYTSSTRQTTFIELYTSQGCSSCPPAEKWLNSFTDHPKLWVDYIPLALHVDYWDYIGWKDSFAQKQFTQRQHEYQSEGSVKTIYTPGFVVNGKEWRGWFSQQKLPDSEKHPGKLSMSVEGTTVKATFTPQTASNEKLQLHIAVLGFDQKVEVKAGENKGEKLAQEFVALHYQDSEPHTTEWTIELSNMPANKPKRIAITGWITPADAQQPIQATGGWWL